MKSALVLFALLVGCSSCNQIPVVATAVIDCTGSHAADVTALYASMKALLTGGGSWTDVEHAAINATKEVGGCALSELVNDYLGGTGGPKPDGQQARATLEAFRRDYAGGATFKTSAGML